MYWLSMMLTVILRSCGQTPPHLEGIELHALEDLHVPSIDALFRGRHKQTQQGDEVVPVVVFFVAEPLADRDADVVGRQDGHSRHEAVVSLSLLGLQVVRLEHHLPVGVVCHQACQAGLDQAFRVVSVCSHLIVG